VKKKQVNRFALIKSISVIKNPSGLAKFVCYNWEFVVSEFGNVADKDFGTEKMGNIYFLKPGPSLL